MTTGGLLLASWGVAHECWLEPGRYDVPTGTRQYLSRCVGVRFKAEPWKMPSQRVRQVLHLAPGHTTDLTTLATVGDTLRTTLSFMRAGTNVVTLRSAETLSTLEGAKFNAYLREDGLTNVLALRTSRKELDKPGREAYSRCLKTLVRVSSDRPGAPPDPADTVWRQRVGLPLELVPERDPYRLHSGDSLVVRLLAGGQPSVGQLVQVWHRARRAGTPTAKPLRLTTDLRGRIAFRLSPATAVLLSSVRMTAHPARDSADWQSTWTSLTFGGPAQ